MIKVIVIGCLLAVATYFVAGSLIDLGITKVQAKDEGLPYGLTLMAKDKPGPGCSVYIYKFDTGRVNKWFVVVERDYQSGVAVADLQ